MIKVGSFKLDEPLPDLNEPQALVILQPWVDVGSVGTLTLLWLETHFEAKGLAELERPGDFFDFTRYRPTSHFKEGRRHLIIPNAHVTYSQPKTGNGFLFFHLLEPHSHGEVYVESLLQLLARFKVKRYCLIGSMYDFVPHSRPLLVTGGAFGKRAEQELARIGIEASNYQGPTTIISLVAQRAPEMEMETMSLIVHLPQYTKLDDDYMGTVPLMKMLGSLYDLPMDRNYIEKAEQQLEQLNVALDRNPELKAIVEQLEAHYEARAKSKRGEEETPPRLSPEVEKFLAEMDKRFREG